MGCNKRLVTKIKSYLIRLQDALKRNAIKFIKSTDEFSNLLLKTWNCGGTVYVMGNGGSSSTAQHFVIDMYAIKLNINNSIYVECITSNTAVVTAIANDICYCEIFSKQLEFKLKPNDLCILVSASGNSQNLIEVCKLAKLKSVKTVGILGFDGGKILGQVDFPYLFETNMGDYGIAEDLHLIFFHSTAELLKSKRQTI